MKNIRTKQAIEIVCLVIAFFLIVWCGIDKSHSLIFDIDEAHKIAETYYYNLYFIKKDLSHPDWNEDFYARTNPPVAKYIMGAYLGSHGQYVHSLSLQQKFEEHWKDPGHLRSYISNSMLNNARTLIVVFSALTLLLVYLIGRLSGSLFLGIISCLLLMFNPIFQHYSTLALTDIILLFFMTSMVLVIVYLIRVIYVEETNNRNYVRCIKLLLIVIIAALVIATASGTKLNGALTAVLFFIAMICGFIIMTVLHERGKLIIKAAKLAFIILTVVSFSFIIFIAINPYLYDSPVAKMISVLKVYDDWMLKQAIDPGHPLWSVMQKISAIGFFNFELPQGYFIKTNLPLLIFFFFAGVAKIIIGIFKSISNRQFPLWYLTVILWAIVYGVGIGIWIPLIWDRYFLPLAPFVAVIAATGIVFIFIIISDLIKKKWLYPEKRKILFSNLIGFACSIILALFVWYNTMDRSILPPYLCIDKYCDDRKIINMYEQAGIKYPENPFRILYTADAKLISHDSTGASLLYGKAIDCFQKAPPSKMSASMTAIAQYQLMKAYLKMSRFRDAEIILESHIKTLRDIEALMRARDQRVIDEFNKTIEERTKYLNNIREVIRKSEKNKI